MACIDSVAMLLFIIVYGANLVCNLGLVSSLLKTIFMAKINRGLG